MRKKLGYFCLFLLIGGCLERYEFVIEDNEPALVVEAFISDKSFNETLLYPSDGRYFAVKLTLTGDVNNTRPEMVKHATVTLLSDAGEAWSYTETEPGLYKLVDDTFKAEKGKGYKLEIIVAEHVYESEWEKLPDLQVPPMGNINFTETEKQTYVYEASESVLRTIQGVTANIHVPENNSGKTIQYRWTFEPLWIYIAPLASVSSAGYKCWATDPYHLKTYTLQVDNSGGYVKDLFFFPTIRNARIFENFSVLVTQHAINEPFFSFWKEMKDRNEGSTLMDVPPYNLRTNFFSSTGGASVSGYFGVSSEQARRWYFDKDDLSYLVPNTLLADCSVIFRAGETPAAECVNCLNYSFGKVTNVKPSWWPN